MSHLLEHKSAVVARNQQQTRVIDLMRLKRPFKPYSMAAALPPLI
jgi:hypothetical protein